MLFAFYLVVKRLMITKNSVMKIQSLVENHQSRPIKLNPKVFFDCPKSPPPKKLPNLPVFNDFTAFFVCPAVHPIQRAVDKGLNVFFPKAAWQGRYGREENKQELKLSKVTPFHSNILRVNLQF